VLNTVSLMVSTIGALVLAGCGAPAEGEDNRFPLAGEEQGENLTFEDDAAVSLEAISCSTTRTTSDRTDDNTRYQVRPLYVLPSNVADEKVDTNGRICRSLAAGAHWLRGQTGGARLRFDSNKGRVDIGFVRLTKTDEQMRGNNPGNDFETGFAFLRDRIEHELKNMGRLKPRKLYAVYYGGSTPWSCGGGAWPPTLIGQVAALYLKGAPPGFPACSTNPLGDSSTVPHYFEYAMVHELMHNLGIVGDLAPQEHFSGHTFDTTVDPVTASHDLMYAVRTSDDPPWATNDPAGLILDINHDDYYKHGQSAYPDLARSVFVTPLPPDAQKPPGW